MQHIISYLILHGIKDPHQIQAIAFLIVDSNSDSRMINDAEEIASMPVKKLNMFIQQVIGGS
jgi:hypothetical protein